MYEKLPDSEKPLTTGEVVQKALSKNALKFFDETGETIESPVIRFPKAKRHAKTYEDETTEDIW